MEFFTKLKFYFFQWLEKIIHTPFSNRVTQTLLYTGAAMIAAPLFEQLVISAILLKTLEIDLDIDIPDTKAYIFGLILIFLGFVHSLIIEHYKSKNYDKENAKKNRSAKKTFNKKVWKLSSEIFDELKSIKESYFLDNSSVSKETITKYLEVKNSLQSKRTQLNKLCSIKAPFQDKAIITALSEITDIINFEVESYAFFLDRLQRDEFENYNSSDAYREAKNALGELNSKLQSLEELIREV